METEFSRSARLLGVTRFRGEIEFTADERIQSGVAALGVKVERAVEVAMIRKPDRVRALLSGDLDQLGDAARPVEKAVVGMIMKMNEQGNLKFEI